jgi:predicted P-loop ATPase
MTIAELTNKVEYLTDATGQRRAVVLDLSLWEELLRLLEELDEQHWDEAFANSQDQLARLADEALAEYHQGKTQELTPELL